MKEYEKPMVDIVSEAAEGVYAASGAPGCDSKYMNWTWQPYTGGWNKTAKELYGCIDCPAYRENGCGLKVDEAYLNGAKSYDTDNGKRMPKWEAIGKEDTYMINDENGLAY